MPAALTLVQHIDRLFAHRKASLDAFLALFALAARLARLRTGAGALYGLTHARLRVLRAIHEHRGASISELGRALDLSRQAVHRVVHDLARMQWLKLERGTRSRRERIPRLLAAGRVASRCGLDWERDWFENLGERASLEQLQGIGRLSSHYRRRLPTRSNYPNELYQPRVEPPGIWRLLVTPP